MALALLLTLPWIAPRCRGDSFKDGEWYVGDPTVEIGGLLVEGCR
jgi:hypothetical protein